MNNLSSFIKRWEKSGGSEQANAQLFLAELCDALDLPRPNPAGSINEDNTYAFERKIYVPRGDGKTICGAWTCTARAASCWNPGRGRTSSMLRLR